MHRTALSPKVYSPKNALSKMISIQLDHCSTLYKNEHQSPQRNMPEKHCRTPGCLSHSVDAKYSPRSHKEGAHPTIKNIRISSTQHQSPTNLYCLDQVTKSGKNFNSRLNHYASEEEGGFSLPKRKIKKKKKLSPNSHAASSSKLSIGGSYSYYHRHCHACAEKSKIRKPPVFRLKDLPKYSKTLKGNISYNLTTSVLKRK